ncbi:MAG: M48 family metallopeptidase [Ruminococcaceae bacterium]|nr:M48 family metallopeptidase [Oscillospiraceae bacterium]
MTPYTVIRSDRRTMTLSVERDGSVLVRAPRRMPAAEIDRFVASHEDWIRTHREKMQRRAAFDEAHFSAPEQITALQQAAERILPAKTAYWASVMGVKPVSVRITGAKTRFGSCSAKDGICYSWRLMAYPEEAQEYVVVHELAHILEKNHSRKFYAVIERYLPDWRQREALLRHPAPAQED